jgi:hypothetical protein
VTSAADRDAHPEVTEISDLTEGLLSPERGAALRAHLADCSLCADVRDSLEEIRGLLGTLPGPQRMPADIAGRIDAALAAEALLSATDPGVPRGTPTVAHTRNSDVPRGTSTAPHGHAPAPTGPGRSHGSRRWRRGLLVAASVAAVVGLGVTLQQVGGGSTNSADSGTAGSKRMDAADPVALQVQRLLQATVGGRTAETSDSPKLNDPHAVDGQSPNPDRAPASVPECVLKATHRTAAPLASDRESFRGTDSYLVVLPHPGDDSLVDAFVVGASCTATSPGAVLFSNTYPR